MVIYYLYFHPTGVQVAFLRKNKGRGRKNVNVGPEDQALQPLALELNEISRPLQKHTSVSTPVLENFDVVATIEDAKNTETDDLHATENHHKQLKRSLSDPTDTEKLEQRKMKIRSLKAGL